MDPSENMTTWPEPEKFQCRTADPTAYEMISNLPDWGIVVLVILSLFTFISLAVYVEEIVFIHRNFSMRSRRNKTLWILALFPVFSITALLAVVVPRSSTIVDIVANAFFATCLYQFIGLIAEYLGGRQATHALLSKPRLVPLNVSPICCCICLPHISLNKNSYQRLQISAIQFAIVRPLLMFIAAVLWSNGSYVAGSISPRGAYLYISLLNILTTMIAMYGLMLTKRAFYNELNDRFKLSLKVGLFQLVLIVSVLPRLIANILVTTNVIKCTDVLPSKGRGEVINHVVMTVLMSVFGMVGHVAFRRLEDASDYSTDSILSSVSSTTAPTLTTIETCSDMSITYSQQRSRNRSENVEDTEQPNESDIQQDQQPQQIGLQSLQQSFGQQQLLGQQLQNEKQKSNILQQTYDQSSSPSVINHL